MRQTEPNPANQFGLRARGYYWVKFHREGGWQVAHWDGRVWNVTALEDNLADEAFDAIDERPLVRFVTVETRYKLAPKDLGLIDLNTATRGELAELGLIRPPKWIFQLYRLLTKKRVGFGGSRHARD